MRSFEHGYFLEQHISQELLMAVRMLGEYRGRQTLYQEQSPELLETLKRVAMVQSVESSNRIEGITVEYERLEAILAQKTKPKNRSEKEVAGYRNVLDEIHANAKRLTITPELILHFHRQMYALTEEKGGHWKEKDNTISVCYWVESFLRGSGSYQTKPMKAAMPVLSKYKRNE